jgi:hypothetical protein
MSSIVPRPPHANNFVIGTAVINTHSKYIGQGRTPNRRREWGQVSWEEEFGTLLPFPPLERIPLPKCPLNPLLVLPLTSGKNMSLDHTTWYDLKISKKNGTLWYMALELIFVSTRTIKRHHHHHTKK